MNVKKVMTKDVIALSPDDTVKDAVKKFASNRISGSPVLDAEGNILGILSEKDILHALETKCKRLEMVYPSLSLVSVSFVEHFDDKEVVDAFTEIANTLVSDLMKKEAITIDHEKSISQAIDLMNNKEINRIPVIDDGRIIGIITRRDIIKGLAETSVQPG